MVGKLFIRKPRVTLASVRNFSDSQLTSVLTTGGFSRQEMGVAKIEMAVRNIKRGKTKVRFVRPRNPQPPIRVV